MKVKKEIRIGVGNRLRELRLSLGKTQDEFAELLGVTQGHYRKVEAGTYELTQEHMITLFRVYKIEPSYLLVGKVSDFDFASEFINCSKKERVKRLAELLDYGSMLLHSAKELVD